MNELRREQIATTVAEFKGKAVTNEQLEAFCEHYKIVPMITAGELSDYTAQVEHDEMIGRLLPKLLSALQKFKYEPEYASESERKAVREGNEELRIELAKIIEDEAIPYRFVSLVGDQLGSEIGQLIKSAGTTIFNKALEVMLHLSAKHFGTEFNTMHVRDYAQKVYDDAEKKDETPVDNKE